MTATEIPQDLITVGEAAKRSNERPQKFHKAIRDNVLATYEKPGYAGRMVSEAEVKEWLAGAGSAKPGRREGSKVWKLKQKDLVEGDFIIRANVQEIMRHVDVVTSTKSEYFSTRGIIDCAPDQWTSMMKNSTARELLQSDQMFVLDRWALLKLLQESFEVTGEPDIAQQLDSLAAAYKERSDQHFKEHKERHIREFEALRQQWLIDNGFIDDPNKVWEDEEDEE